MGSNLRRYLGNTQIGATISSFYPRSIIFDASAQGVLAPKFVHTRGAASVDGLGVSVAIDEPRYDRPSLWTSPVASSRVEEHDVTDANFIYAYGKGHNNTDDIAMLARSTSNKVNSYVNDITTPTIENAFAAYGNDLMKNTIGTKKFLASAFAIRSGLCLAVTHRFDGSTEEGIALLYSNDVGTTWNAIQDQSSNYGLPDRVSTRTRGTRFCLQNIYQEGNSTNPTELWAAFTDYEFNSGATGGQTGLCRFTRTTGTSTDWVSHGLRLIYSEDGELSGTHFHCAGVTIDGTDLFVLTSVGDTTTRNHLTLSHIDLSGGRNDYLTGTITTNTAFNGRTGIAVGAPSNEGTKTNQFTSIAPGPDNRSWIVTADFAKENICKIRIPDGATPATAIAEQTFIHGINYAENFCVVCRDPHLRQNYASCDRVGAASVNSFYYSLDGEHWGSMPQIPYGGVGQLGFFGDKIIHAKDADGLYSYDIPQVSLQRPLLINPGNENRSGVTWSNWTAPATGITWTEVPRIGGVAVYPTGHSKAGTALPEQPQSLCPIFWFQCDGQNSDGGWKYITAFTKASYTGDIQNAIVQIMSIDESDGSGIDCRVVFDSTNTNAYIESNPNQSWWTERYTGDTIPSGSARPASKWLSRKSTTKKESSVLITIPVHGPGLSPNSYPSAPDTDASGLDTIAYCSAVDLSVEWSITLNTVTTYFAANVNTEDLYVISVVKDASNYIEVKRTASNTVELKVVIAGTPTTTSITGLWWGYGSGSSGKNIQFVLSEFAGSTTLDIFGDLDGTGTVGVAIGSGAVDINFGANNDRTIVSPLAVYSLVLND